MLRAFVLAKDSSYFYDALAFPLGAYTKVTEETGIRIVSAAGDNTGGKKPLPEGRFTEMLA